VDLCHYVKMSEFIGDVKGAKKVCLVWVAHGAGVDENKGDSIRATAASTLHSASSADSCRLVVGSERWSRVGLIYLDLSMMQGPRFLSDGRTWKSSKSRSFARRLA
jgi:hypothetical protein